MPNADTESLARSYSIVVLKSSMNVHNSKWRLQVDSHVFRGSEVVTISEWSIYEVSLLLHGHNYSRRYIDTGRGKR